MPRKWQGLLAGLCIVALTGFYLWGKDRLANRPNPTTPVSLNAHYGPTALIPLADRPPQVAGTLVAQEMPVPPGNSAEPPVQPLTPAPAPITLTGASEPIPLPPAPVAAPPAPVSQEQPFQPAPAVPPPAVVPAAVQPVPVQPAPAAVQQTSATQVPVPVNCPWLMSLQIVEGRSRLEARTEAGVELRISCGKLNLRYPDGDIEANGHVSFVAGHMEGTCERLTLSWRDSKIMMVGNVRMKGRQDNQEVDLAGDSMTFRLTTLGKSRRDSIIAPASYSTPAPLLPQSEKVPEPASPPPAVPAPVPAPIPDPAPLGNPSPSGALNPGKAPALKPARPAVATDAPPKQDTTPGVGVSESQGPTQPGPLRDS